MDMVVNQLNFNYCNCQGELARIKKAGGEVFMGKVNGNLNLSRAIADFEYKKNKNINYDLKNDIKIIIIL